MRYWHEIILEHENCRVLGQFTRSFSLHACLPLPHVYQSLEEVDIFFFYLFTGLFDKARQLHDELGLEEALTWPRPTGDELHALKQRWPNIGERVKRARSAIESGGATLFAWKLAHWGGPNDLSRLDWYQDFSRGPLSQARAGFKSQFCYIKGLSSLAVVSRARERFHLSFAVFDTRDRVVTRFENGRLSEPYALERGELLEEALSRNSTSHVWNMAELSDDWQANLFC
jgi:hypothetical protein